MSTSPVVRQRIALALANHWSYTGIGWQLGVESCAQSIDDSVALLDYEPSVKTCINLDAACYPLVADHYPQVIARLRATIQQGGAEVIGGTYGQPLGSMIGSESNIRQLVVGCQTIKETLHTRIATFLEEEEFSHPQLPQLLRQAGFRFASTAQCDTWGKHGAPKYDKAVVEWIGRDGTSIPTAPINDLVFHPPVVTQDIDWLLTADGHACVDRLSRDGVVPLVLKWTEFGWEDCNGQAINKFDPVRFRELAEQYEVDFVTLGQFLANADGVSQVSPRADDFHKLLPWGVGGDGLRRHWRRTEALLLTAERLAAVARLEGWQAPTLSIDVAWQDLLVSQSHDVALCEYSRWQGGVSVPLEPIIDKHGQTWGALGYEHLGRAKSAAEKAVNEQIKARADAVAAPKADGRHLALVVFNPTVMSRNDVIEVKRLDVRQLETEAVCLQSGDGEPILSQVASAWRDGANRLAFVDLLIAPNDVAGLGHDAVLVRPQERASLAPHSDLRVDAARLRLENEHLIVELHPERGGICRVHDKRTGRDFFQNDRPLPGFFGRPNVEAVAPKHRGSRDAFDSRTRPAEIKVVEQGPVRATVQVRYDFQGVALEIRISLEAGCAYADVRMRLFASVPPIADTGTINGWQLPLEITEGYWFDVHPGFTPDRIVRDYPFGVEPTEQDEFFGLRFVDFISSDRGLLLIHEGSQYFKHHAGGFRNLAMREWESCFGGEYGWPRMSDYRYRLVPHDGRITDADRWRHADAFDLPLVSAVSEGESGSLPAHSGGRMLRADDVVLSSLRPIEQDVEMRLFRCGENSAPVVITTDERVKTASCTNFLSEASAELSINRGEIELDLPAWRIQTVRLTLTER